jgi:replicative DNA helicase
MFIHRPDKSASEKDIEEGKVAANVAEILVEKHRSGPTGVVKLYFRGECTKFVNLNEETGEPEVETLDGESFTPSKAERQDLTFKTEKVEFEPSNVDDEIF